jgi:sugar phosphate isomerase/epimerase
MSGTRDYQLALDFMTAVDLRPVELIAAAAVNGCSRVSLLVHPHPAAALPDHGLLSDAKVRRDARAAADDAGIQIDMIEAFIIGPDTDIAEFRAAFECGVALGATFVNALVRDPEESRRIDNIRRYCELANQCGLTPMLEPVGTSSLATFPTAVETLRRVGFEGLVLEVDTLQLVRTNANLQDVAAIDPALIGRAQINDGPLKSTLEPRYEALEQRQIPGEGEFPLLELLQALPRKPLTLGVEVPNRKLREEGVSGAERVRLAVEGARNVLHEISSRLALAL